MKKLFLLFLIITSCGKNLPVLEGFDLNAWKDDKNGCNHFREKCIAILGSQKDKLKGLSEDEVIRLLGRPDQNELYKRNQKFFHYFVGVSPKCKEPSQNAKKLSIRFTAMGFAKEVEIE